MIKESGVGTFKKNYFKSVKFDRIKSNAECFIQSKRPVAILLQ